MDILAIGEPLIELSSEAHLPSAGTFRKSYGGDILNTAVAASRLGSRVGLATLLGADPFGEDLSAFLRVEAIDLPLQAKRRGTTGLYFTGSPHQNQPGEKGQFVYYRKDSAPCRLNPSMITPALLAGVKVVFATGITTAISESARKTVVKAFKMAKKAGILTAFDPNYRSALWPRRSDAFEAMLELFPYIDILMPSFPDDIQPLFELDKMNRVIEYFPRRGIRLLVLKTGASGCTLHFKGETQHISAMGGVAVVDSVGAGDAFNGAFLHGICSDQSLLDCARLGVTAAGIKISRRGTAQAMPTRQDVYVFMPEVEEAEEMESSGY